MKTKAFTLIELLLVIAIIASLAGIILYALNPAQRLNEAQEVKAQANGNDIQKALNAYPLTNNGQFPTALQTKINNGETRVDICVSGQTCNGVDLTTDLVGGGFLNSIPIHPTYATSTDSGYDIVYGGIQGVQILESPVYLLRDEFITAAAAPLTTPRTAEPGPGSWTAYDVGTPIMSIINGNIQTTRTTTNLEFVGLSSGPWPVVAGRTILATRNSGNYTLGWNTSNTLGAVGDTSIYAGAHTGVDVVSAGQYAYLGTGMDSNDIAVVQQSTMFLLLTRTTTGIWKLNWPTRQHAQTNLYGQLSWKYQTQGSVKNVRIIDLPAPFNSDYGIATDRKSGSVPVSSTFNHEANSIIEYTATTLPTSTGAIRVVFRYINSNNYMQLNIGNDGSLNLYHVVSGVSASIGSSAASTVSAGHRVVIIADGTVVRVYTNNTLRFTGTTSIISGISGNILTLDNSAAISNLSTWPRTLSGDAAQVLENATL